MASSRQTLKSAFDRHDSLEQQSCLERFIIHLRQRLQSEQLTLIVGAGISAEAKAPLWNDLVARLQKKLDGGGRIKKTDPRWALGPAFLSQILFRRFAQNAVSDSQNTIPSVYRHVYANAKWMSEIRNELYKDVPSTIPQIIRKHSYIENLAKLSNLCRITINFNFDDILFSVAKIIDNNSSPILSWNLPNNFPKKNSLIYHINGFIPRSELKRGSQRLVFTEGAFAEWLPQTRSYESMSVLRFFSENTVIIVGCSLDDTSLKTMLRASMDVTPSNYHYYVYWMKDRDALSREQMIDIFHANLDIYNMVTLFLTSRELNDVFNIILENDESIFLHRLNLLGARENTFRFYVTGPVSVGKSTLLERLRNFRTYEEWLKSPPDPMYKDKNLLTEAEKRNINRFLSEQLIMKNKIMQEVRHGFFVMDRSYLDLFAFSDSNDENISKLEMIKNEIIPTGSFQNGQVIFLMANGKTLEDRQWKRGKIPRDHSGLGYSQSTLESQQELLCKIYDNCWVYDTSNSSPDALARQVGRDILMREYSPINFSDRVKFVENGGLADTYPEKGKHVKK